MGMKKQLLKRWGDRSRLTGRNLSNSESSTSLPRWQLSWDNWINRQPGTGRTGHDGAHVRNKNCILQLINILFLHLIHHKMNSVVTALFLSSGHFNCVSGQHASLMTSSVIIWWRHGSAWGGFSLEPKQHQNIDWMIRRFFTTTQSAINQMTIPAS